MTAHYKINGIRLNRHLIELTRKNQKGEAHIGGPGRQNSGSGAALYQGMADHQKNLVLLVRSGIEDSVLSSGVMQAKYFDPDILPDLMIESYRQVSTVSIYPHNYQLPPLASLLSFLDREQLRFRQLVSSNAMLTFVIDAHGCDEFVDRISSVFELPPTHTPFEQEEDEEQEAFIRRKYPETRASYVEAKIKTYGVVAKSGLTLSVHDLPFFQNGLLDKALAPIQATEQFVFLSAWMRDGTNGCFVLISQDPEADGPRIRLPVDMLTIQGPHFGDRWGIIHRTFSCLHDRQVPLLFSGCTGASISLVFSQGMGEEAIDALQDVFETA